MEQVRTDPEVRDRFMRHFAMGEAELIEYFQTLHPAKLNRGGLYKIYSVPEDRVIKVRVDQLKAGELVFADSSGRPVLLLRCGNPLTLGPANPMIANDVAPGTEEAITTELEALDVPSEAAGFADIDYVTPLAPSEPVFVAAPVVTGGGEPAVLAPSGGGGGGLGLLAGLPLLLLIGGGGGSAVIPEPTTMIAFGTGIAALVARRRRRK